MNLQNQPVRVRFKVDAEMKRTPKRALTETTATFSMPRELKEKIARLAAKKLINTSALTRQVLAQYIQDWEKENGKI